MDRSKVTSSLIGRVGEFAVIHRSDPCGCGRGVRAFQVSDGIGDVTGHISQHDSPGGRIFPCLRPQSTNQSVVGNPSSQYFPGLRIDSDFGWDAKITITAVFGSKHSDNSNVSEVGVTDTRAFQGLMQNGSTRHGAIIETCESSLTLSCRRPSPV
jgi:hypothetical protein